MTTYSDNPVIAHVEVVEVGTHAVDVRVRTLFAGETNETRLTILRGGGADCKDGLQDFDLHEEYLIVANKFLNNESYSLALLECGISFLPVVQGKIIGPVTSNRNFMSLADFANLEECALERVLTMVSVNPNLSNTEFVVRTTDDIEQVEISVYDMAGRQIYTYPTAALLVSEPRIIPARHLAPGCYAVVVRTGSQRRTFKVIAV